MVVSPVGVDVPPALAHVRIGVHILFRQLAAFDTCSAVFELLERGKEAASFFYLWRVDLNLHVE